ncbi:MAG: hypothetical protein Ct9H300mP28_01260 [Pseudomonadota bacterium]|nr:MAG: hypothetical protein Ct9H300mP28_01260 [Pseudomonadota bacterium]
MRKTRCEEMGLNEKDGVELLKFATIPKGWCAFQRI